MMKKESDPVFQDEFGVWWFWDETWSYAEGPYTTEESAREGLEEYCANELGWLPNDNQVRCETIGVEELP